MSTFTTFTGTGSQMQQVPNSPLNTQAVFICIPLAIEETYVPVGPGAFLQPVFQYAFLVLSPEVFSLPVPIPSKGEKKKTPWRKLVCPLLRVTITMAKKGKQSMGQKEEIFILKILILLNKIQMIQKIPRVIAKITQAGN